MKRIFNLLLCLFLVLTNFNIVVKAEEETIVYLDPAGTSEHSENVYTTLASAVTALPDSGGTIVVCSDSNINTSASVAYKMDAKPIRITGENPNVKLTQLRTFFINDDLTIDNITWVNKASASYAFFYCQGHDLTVGDNVTCTPNGSTYLCLFTGSTSAISNGNSTITVNSGTFRNIFGGSIQTTYSGTSNIIINGGTIGTNIFCAGSGISSKKANSSGTVNITINGGSVASMKLNSDYGTFNGTANVNLKGGTVNAVVDLTPVVDLSLGGTLNLNTNIIASNIIGGGTLNLGDGNTLTSNDLNGTLNLSIANPVKDNTYLVVNNVEATGEVNYLQTADEILVKNVNSNNISYTVGEATVPIVVDTVYVDSTGTIANSYSTFADAADALPSSGGTIILASDASIATSTAHYHMPNKPIRVVGENPNIKLTLNRSWFINAETTIENLTLVNNSSASYAFIYLQGNDFTVGEDVTCVANGSTYLCILAGSASVANAKGAITNANATITINSGTFRRIFCGGLSVSYSGNTTINLNGGTIASNIYFAGSGAAGSVNGTVNLNINGANVADISKNSASGVFNGEYDIVLKAGSVGTFNNAVPSTINLSDGGTLTINKSIEVESVIGGGKIVLGGGASLITNTLTGNINLEVNEVNDGLTVLTINDENTNGVVNYIAKTSESLERVVEDGDVRYIMSGEKVHVKVTYYNPNGQDEIQPNIVIYKGYSTDTDKVKITDLTEGIIDGYKNYIEVDLNPGLYYYLVYYNSSNDYLRKYFYISGNETSTVEFDMPLVPTFVNNYEERTVSYTTDQVLNRFWNWDNLNNVDDIELVTPSFTMEKYLINNRKFTENEDLCNFVDSLESPYLHVYYPFELTPMGNRNPVLVFTKDEVDANISLADLANEVRSVGTREIFMINGGQHGNEPSGMEGALQFAYELCGNYEELLDHFGAIVILPNVSADNIQRFKREFENGLNSNRDLIYLSREGSQLTAYIYSLFMPTVFASCHEDNENNRIDTADNNAIDDIHNLAYCCLSTPNSPLVDTNGMINNTWDIKTSDQALMLQRLLDKANAQGFRAEHYPVPSYASVSERTYTYVRGAYAFLIEVQRIWSGKANYEFSTKEMVVALKNLADEVISMDTNDEKTIAQKVYEARQAAKVTEYDENNYFALKVTASNGGTDPFVKAYADGTYENTTRVWKVYDTITEYRSLPVSYVIPADLSHINEILHLLDMHGISYTRLDNGTTRVLKRYSIADTTNDASKPVVTIGENSEVTFENGAYEISLNTSDSYLVAYLFEPDSYVGSTFYYASLYNMQYIGINDDLYRYETDIIPTGDPVDITFMVDNNVYETLQDVLYNSLIDEPVNAPEKEGYVFTGWYKDVNCTSKWNFTKDRVTEDKILYAGFMQGHKVTVLNAGYGTAHNTTESSSWASTTGGEVHENYVTTVGDFSNTSGAALSIYTDLSDVTAIKFKVGNNEEVVLDYAGKTMTRYLKANNTITSSGNANTDIVKIAVNASTSTLTSTRFYNITDDITITFVHNTYTMNYLDENNLTKSFEYDSLVNGYVPSGYSYEVAQTSLSSKTAGEYANMHIEVDNTVKGLLVSNGTSEITFLSDDSHIVDTTFGNIEITYSNGAYDVSFISLNSNVTVSPVTNVTGHHISVVNAGQANGGKAIECTNWEAKTGGKLNSSGILTTLDDYSINEGLPVRIYTSIGKLKAITITEGVFSHTFNTNNLQIDIDQYLNNNKYRIVREKDDTYFDVYFYEIKGDIQINIEYDDVIIDFADPYSSAKSYNRNEYPNSAEISAYDDSIIVNSLDLNNTKAGSVQIGIVPNNDKMSGIIITDGDKEVVYEQANNGSGPTDYTFGKMVLAKASGYYFVRFYYLNTDVTIKPKTIDTVSAFQKATLNADGTTSLNLSLKVSPSVNVSDAFLRLDGQDIALTSLNKNIDGTDNITYSYKFDNISAKNMGDEHTVQFFKNNEETFTSENVISIRNYLGQIANSESYSNELKEFSNAMINYSKYVQNYFAYDSETVGELDESAIENIVVDENNNHAIAGTTEGISAYGQDLVLKYYTDFRIYFKLDGSHTINEYVFKDGDETLIPQRANNSMYYVRVSRLAAPDLATKHNISVRLGNEGDLNVVVSALSYANLIIKDANEDPNLIKAMKAMYGYNQSAVILKNEVINKVSSLDDITPYNGEKLKIAFIGDSITYGYKASDPSIKSYPAVFNTLFNERYEVGNYGVSAAYTIAADSPYNYRASTPKLSYKNTKRYIPSRDFNPDVVLIMLGTNDIRSLLSYGENGVEAYKNALKDLVQDYQTLDSVSKVYIVSSVVINKNTDLGLYSKGDLQAIQKAVADELGIDYIDVYTPTKDVFLNSPSTYFYSDNIHFTDVGYGLIAETLYNYFID